MCIVSFKSVVVERLVLWTWVCVFTKFVSLLVVESVLLIVLIVFVVNSSSVLAVGLRLTCKLYCCMFMYR